MTRIPYRSRLVGIFIGLVLNSPAVGGEADVVREFGLLGLHAVDCDSEPSVDNPHVTTTIGAEGLVSNVLNMGPDYGDTAIIRNPRLETSDMLKYEHVDGMGDVFTVSVLRTGLKFQSWSSVRDDGVAFIANGRFSDSNEPTPVFETCKQRAPTLTDR